MNMSEEWRRSLNFQNFLLVSTVEHLSNYDKNMTQLKDKNFKLRLKDCGFQRKFRRTFIRVSVIQFDLRPGLYHSRF